MFQERSYNVIWFAGTEVGMEPRLVAREPFFGRRTAIVRQPSTSTPSLAPLCGEVLGEGGVLVWVEGGRVDV